MTDLENTGEAAWQASDEMVTLLGAAYPPPTDDDEEPDPEPEEG